MGIYRLIRGNDSEDEYHCSIPNQNDEIEEGNDNFEPPDLETYDMYVIPEGNEDIWLNDGDEIDDEEVINDVSYASSPIKRRKTKIPSDSFPSHNSLGRRKARRIANSKHLLDLVDGETDDIDDCNSSVFSRILKNEPEFEVWETFLNATEEQQLLITSTKHAKNRGMKRNKKKIIKAEEAFQFLNPSQRFVVKTNRNLGFLSRMEPQIATFFLRQPADTYVSPGFNSFERLILHAIASYYQLNSFSCNTDEENEKILYITNAEGSFRIPNSSLCTFLNRHPEDERRTSRSGLI